eukprot:1153580-Pelagomonas_calceolata.AAC.1
MALIPLGKPDYMDDNAVEECVRKFVTNARRRIFMPRPLAVGRQQSDLGVLKRVWRTKHDSNRILWKAGQCSSFHASSNTESSSFKQNFVELNCHKREAESTPAT